VSSGFLSSNLTIDFNNEAVADAFFHYEKPSVLKKIRTKLENYFFLSQRQKIVKQFDRVKEKLECEMATLPFSNYQLHKHPMVQEADIINLHWIGGILDYPNFFEHCQKPIVWTLHDMNPFQGLFHYREDQNRNSKIIAHFDSEMKQIKIRAIKLIKCGTIVSPSKWLMGEVKKSDVFVDFKEEYIPNAINLELFKLQDKEALKKAKSIGSDEFVILFVSDSLKNYRKGFNLLTEALMNLKNINVTVLAIGKGTIPTIGNLKIISLGEINSPSEMAACYAIADVFVLPSREDNLPNVMLESFACGTPVLGFNIGGIAEHTIDNITGILADEMTSQSLTTAIRKFYQTRNNYNNSVIRKYAEENFSFKKQADSYIALYEKVVIKKNLK
jgi:glycosyltransferase involved in cell wall biosynthesis